MKKEKIKNSAKYNIYSIRNKQVMIDDDIAESYNVSLKSLNQAVKRNKERFPERFMFQLSEEEFKNLRSQIVTAKKNWRKKRFLPYVFTEQGVAMLSGILRSKRATKVSISIMDAFVSMRRFIQKNAGILQRIENNELKLMEHDKYFKEIFKNKSIREPKQGIFYEGQIFEAYKFVSDLIRSANKSVILIDNYIDESVLTLLSKKDEKVDVYVYTKNVTKQLRLDFKKHNSQYPQIGIRKFEKSHDRFLIIDGNVYHIGASLKDLGKRWFAFSKMEDTDILEKIKNLE